MPTDYKRNFHTTRIKQCMLKFVPECAAFAENWDRANAPKARSEWVNGLLDMSGNDIEYFGCAVQLIASDLRADKDEVDDELYFRAFMQFYRAGIDFYAQVKGGRLGTKIRLQGVLAVALLTLSESRERALDFWKKTSSWSNVTMHSAEYRLHIWLMKVEGFKWSPTAVALVTAHYWNKGWANPASDVAVAEYRPAVKAHVRGRPPILFDAALLGTSVAAKRTYVFTPSLTLEQARDAAFILVAQVQGARLLATRAHGMDIDAPKAVAIQTTLSANAQAAATA